MTHTLYRFYGVDDVLLYIGLTCNPGLRFMQHRDDKNWWPEIRRIVLEQHDTREALIDAERAAIQAEKPLYNIQGNRTRPRAIAVPIPKIGEETWTFQSLRYGDQRTGLRIELVYELDGSSMSDDYYVDDASAEDLLYLWHERYMPAGEVYGLPTHHAPIFWFAEFNKSPGFEGAPFCAMSAKLEEANDSDLRNFLSYFTWPVSEQTGRPLNWLTLPVQDQAWNADRTDKGGFIQEATGWKPSPFQSSADIVQLALLAGIRLPVSV